MSVGLFIIKHHFLLSEYLQEIGRGGRDGKQTNTLILISEPTGLLDPSDQQRNKYFLQQLHKNYQQAKYYFRQIPKQGNIIILKEEMPKIETF